MRIRSLAFVGSLLMALLVPAAANAYQSITTGGVNVRTGAGVNYAQIATLPPSASVWVDYCRRSWCLVRIHGLKGWVSARYLAGTGGVYRYQPPVVYVAPVIGFSFGVPRYSYHDYGYHHNHHFKRKFYKNWNNGSGKHKGNCPPWKCD